MKRALSISEVSKIACVSRGTVYNWINNNQINYESLPGRNGKPVFRIRNNDLQEFLERNYNAKLKPKSPQREMLFLPQDGEDYA